ncbi:MAG: protein translocase subunit SecD [Akkermansiaceae bacterium]
MHSLIASTFIDDKLFVFLAGLGLLALFFWYFATDFERKKRNIGTIICVLIGLFSFMSFIPMEKWGSVITGETPLKEAHTLQGGIDLVGGSSFTLRVQPNKDSQGNEIPVDKTALEQAIQTIEKRLNAFGTSDLMIMAQGEDRIIVQMPGVSPEKAKAVRKTLEEVAKLELKLVHPQNDSLADLIAADPENESEPGYDFFIYNGTDNNGDAFTDNMLLKQIPIMDGSYIEHAQERYGADIGKLDVNLSSEGADKMYRATSKLNLGRDRMAIVLDGKILSAPTVNDALSKNFVISGMADANEARAIAAALRNPLKNPLIVDGENTVSATLGKETINQGIIAGIVGLALTLIFVLLYYRFAGIIALMGLSLNILILFGTMAMFEFSFTLPGIAGIILTIGVAVDANVLIYERLREELANGKSVKAAISAAYEKAFSAIFDANITTLITAIILFWKASGTVKGFAVTLTIGILASMLAALLCTRVLFWWAADTGVLKKLNFMNLIPERSFDFLSKRKLAFTVSVVLILAGLSAVGIKGNGALGIDFTGGTRLSFQLDEDTHIPQTKAQKILSGLSLSQGASSQEEKNTGGNLFSVRCANNVNSPEVIAGAPSDAEKIEAALRSKFDFLQEKETIINDKGEEVQEYVHQMDQATVSATLGGEFLVTACWALALGLFAILIYITIRFEFSFALGAFAALFHDILICLGIIVLKGDEISLIHVGAFLTIAGYSINDTIVVFDRIREDLRSRRGEVPDVMNHAINSTLSRTVLTSLTTFVAVCVLYIFGGSALKDFSFAIMIGVVVGTYSSIFIASPVVYIWSKMRGTNLRRELLDANLEAEVNPARN